MIKSTTQTNIQSNPTYSPRVEQQKRDALKAQEIQRNETEYDRVAKIKEEMKQGTYKIDLKQTSEKMALNLLNL